MAAPTLTEHRSSAEQRPNLAGVPVREEDIEQVKGLRTVALLFRGMAVLLLALMIMQVALGLTSTVAISYGVMVADAVRLTIFAGLLWGFGDLAVLWVKSHYDLRATKILMARTAHMVQRIGEAAGHLPPSGGDGPHSGRGA
jgi:hypothetical protein